MLLAVFGTGVFLAGLELMITAVALPSILADLAESWIGAPAGLLDHQRLPAGLRADDAAGRPPGRPVGCPPALPGRPRRLRGRVGAGRAAPSRSTSSSRRGSSRPSAAAPRPGRDRRRVPPVRGARPAAGPRGHRGADVPRDGRRTVRRARRSSRRSMRTPRWRAGASSAGPLRASWRRPGAGSSTSTSRSGIVALVVAWAASRLGDADGGPAAWTSPGAFSVRRRPGRRAASDLTLIGDRPIAGGSRPGPSPAGLLAVSRLAAGRGSSCRGLRGHGSVPRHRASSATASFSCGASSRCLTGYALRHGDHRRGRLRGPGPVRRPGRAAPGARRARRGDRRRGARLRLPGPVPSPPLVSWSASSLSIGALLAMSAWTPATALGQVRSAWASSGSASG